MFESVGSVEVGVALIASACGFQEYHEMILSLSSVTSISA